MSRELVNTTTGSLWWKACNKGHSICHFGVLDPGQGVSTGQQYLSSYSSEDALRQAVDHHKGEGYYDSIMYPPTGSLDGDDPSLIDPTLINPD